MLFFSIWGQCWCFSYWCFLHWSFFRCRIFKKNGGQGYLSVRSYLSIMSFLFLCHCGGTDILVLATGLTRKGAIAAVIPSLSRGVQQGVVNRTMGFDVLLVLLTNTASKFQSFRSPLSSLCLIEVMQSASLLPSMW